MKKVFMMMAVAAVFMMLGGPAASAEDWEKYDKPVKTRIVVRVLSHGAKVMSPHTGAVVILRDARTGAELDKGGVEGDTGDTVALMNAMYPRTSGLYGLTKGEKGVVVNDKKAEGADTYYNPRAGYTVKDLETGIHESETESAKYVGEIAITKPTQVLVEVYGPLMPRHSTATAVSTTWVFPGENIEGEGIVVDLRGLIVDLRDSLREKLVKFDEAKDGIDVDFYMRMMCGCPIAPADKGLPWKAESYSITIQAYYKGKLYYEDKKTADKLFKQVSFFTTRVPLPKDLPDGKYEKEKLKIRVMASQPEQANYGIDELNMYVSK